MLLSSCHVDRSSVVIKHINSLLLLLLTNPVLASGQILQLISWTCQVQIFMCKALYGDSSTGYSEQSTTDY